MRAGLCGFLKTVRYTLHFNFVVSDSNTQLTDLERIKVIILSIFDACHAC